MSEFMGMRGFGWSAPRRDNDWSRTGCVEAKNFVRDLREQIHLVIQNGQSVSCARARNASRVPCRGIGRTAVTVLPSRNYCELAPTSKTLSANSQVARRH